MSTRAILSTLLCLLAAGAAAQDHRPAQPYAGLERRAIKALDETEIGDLKAGNGMGLALAAELNRYPGPRHLLELADRIGLDAGRRAQIAAIEARMTEAAKASGERILQLEAELDRRFAEGAIAPDTLKDLLRRIGEARAELRYIHLETHLAVRPLLTAAEVARYDQLRGYGDGGANRPGTGHGHQRHH